MFPIPNERWQGVKNTEQALKCGCFQVFALAIVHSVQVLDPTTFEKHPKTVPCSSVRVCQNTLRTSNIFTFLKWNRCFYWTSTIENNIALHQAGCAGWWFGTFCNLHYIGDNHPTWAYHRCFIYDLFTIHLPYLVGALEDVFHILGMSSSQLSSSAISGIYNTPNSQQLSPKYMAMG